MRRSRRPAAPASSPTPAAARGRSASAPVPTTPPAVAPRRATLLAVLAVVAALALTLAWIGWKALRDPDVSFLSASPGAEWIVYPSPANPTLHPATGWGAVFVRSFPLADFPPSAELRIRACRRFQLTVNGQPVLRSDDESSWKRERRVDVTGLLRAGENRIEVFAANRLGPPALWLRLVLPGQTIGTDPRWEASWAGASWVHAARADARAGSRWFTPDGPPRSPVDALLARRGTVALLALLSAAIVALGGLWIRRQRERTVGALSSRWAPWVVLGVAAAAWAALFVNDARWLSVGAGFDAQGHLDYIRYIIEHHSLPPADQGWQTHQPPLYYLIAALVLGAAGLTVPGPDAAAVLRGLGLLYGVANLVLIGAALRLVFPAHPRRQLLGLLVATFLPMSLTLYQLPTNEVLAATLSSAVLLVTLLALRSDLPSFRLHALLGLCMGLALMAKFSALLVVFVALGVLAARLVARPRPVVLRGLVGLGLVVGLAIAIAGRHYGATWLRAIAPLLGSSDPSTGPRWWQDPGYRTAHDFLVFGRAFSAPFYSALTGIWDGLYTTLWGDGSCSGQAVFWTAPPWCSDLMSAGYLLATIPALAMAVGAVVFLVRWIRLPNLRDTAILGTAFAAFAAVVFMALQVPYYGMVKAFYGVSALLPLCVFAGLGLDLAMARAGRAAPLLMVLLGTWALMSYGSLWLGARSPRALAFSAESAFLGGDDRAGARLLKRAIAQDPADWNARNRLARYMVRQGASRQEVRALFEADPGPGPDLMVRHAAFGQIAVGDGDLDRAVAEAGKAIALNPDMPEGYLLEAQAREARAETQKAIAAWREVLRIDPFNFMAHQALGRLLARSGAPDSVVHQRFAARLGGESR